MDKINLVVNFILLFGFARAEIPRRFPTGFSFGVGSSAYQIEGAWNEDGKSENIWDHWIHTDPSRIKDNATADVACNSYNDHIIDAILVYHLEAQHYRLSIPWSRILPNGVADEINMKAVMHYQELISILGYLSVDPVVTLYYHDLPQSMQDIGGWTNPKMADYFADYARVCFQYFYDIKKWITFNDPRAICRNGYGDGTMAPGINSDGIGEYLCASTVLKAHAAAYHVYKEEFKDLKGQISIAIDMKWSEPASKNDIDAVQRRNAFEFGLYADPIYKGNWPTEVIERIAYRSTNENFTKSRLPEFTEEEIGYINNTADFMAVNLFDTNLVEDTEEAEFNDTGYMNDIKAKVYLHSNWSLAENGKAIAPWGATKTLVWLKENYNNPKIFITENGVPDKERFSDHVRINYFRNYLNAILNAILDNKVNVIGYTARSAFDSFEWTDGYSYRYGFYYVEDNENRARSRKLSFSFYNQVVTTFYVPEETTTTTITTTTTVPPTTPGSATKMALPPILLLAGVFLFNFYLK